MPEAVTHPTPQELAAFGLGKLTGRAAAAVARHLEGCAACQQVVAGLPPDSFLGKVRAAGPAASVLPPGAGPGGATALPNRAARPAAPPPDLPPELANHPKYRILRELGRGGMGVVYQARQTVMNRQVVIKVVNKALLDHPDALERFRREVQAAASLSHPNIVTAYDAEQAGDLHLLVMEFVPGQSLAEVLQKKGRLPVTHACHCVRQAALGLQHAHERGMVHRDIKPHNLMLTPRGQVKILDFGLAKMAVERGAGKGLTASGAYMGTPDYSAPEQAKDARSADIRADLYSLGCTLYCLLAGHPPFQADTPILTILAHLEKEPVPLPHMRPDVPPKLWAVVARLLAKDPAQRYQKPAEVAQALAPFAKPGAKVAPAPRTIPPEVASPGRGTLAPQETNRLPVASPAVPAKPAQEEPDLGIRALKTPRRRRSESTPDPKRNQLGCLAAALTCGIVGLVVAVTLLSGVIVRVTTPNGVALLENVPPDAEVSIDGRKVIVKIAGDGEPIRIELPDEKQHELKVIKGGFEAYTHQVTVPAGKSQRIRVKWLPLDGDGAAEIKAVVTKLKERNPGFDGAVTPTIENGNLTGLGFVTDHVTDLSPLRALTRLKSLNCGGSAPSKGRLTDLSPLKGMPLTFLACHNNRVEDLSPLKGMPLEILDCLNNPVNGDLSPLKGMPLKLLGLWDWKGRDLSPLKGMPLERLNCGGSAVEDLSPLAGMPLNELTVNWTSVSDLSPLKGMPLKWLAVAHTRVSDITLLKGMPLSVLGIDGSPVTDLTPIRGLPLTELFLDFRPERDTEILRSIKTLEKINGKPAGELLKKVDGGPSPAGPPGPPNGPEKPILPGGGGGKAKGPGADRGAGAEEIAKQFTNAIGMELVRIPGTRETYPATGKFTMGSPRSESQQLPEWGKGEDQHEVEVSPFHLGVYEVTQRQFREMMGYNPSYFSTNARGKDGGHYGEQQPGGGKGRIPPGESTEDYPVENVSWEEAREFCEKLTARDTKKPTGWLYRLPTEAEWEYACRGGAPGYQTFAFGNSIDSTQANFVGVRPFPWDGAKGPNLQRTCKVGQYRPNGFGLFNMHGNVWEWCGDWWSEDYYRKSPSKDPTGPADDTGGKVYRGGSWHLNGWDCRSARRSQGLSPTERTIDIGFRAALVPPGGPLDPSPAPSDKQSGVGAAATVERSLKPKPAYFRLYLSDLEEFGWEGMAFSKAEECKANGVTYLKTVYMHPLGNGKSRIKYRMNDLSAHVFEAKVALRDTVPVGSATPLTFQVVGDDKVLWNSKPIQARGDTQDCSVAVEGIHVLELRVVCPGYHGWAHAVWLDPRILSNKPTDRADAAAGAAPRARGARPALLDCTGGVGVSAVQVRRAQEAWAKYLGRKVEETVEVADGVKMTFVLVPPGKFRMGSPAGEAGRNMWEPKFDSETLHAVTLTEPFELGTIEVTQAQYQALTGNNPSHINFRGDGKPVGFVSWEEASDYAVRLTKRRSDRHLYRLPTEAEWEYACRGGRPSSQPFGVGDGRTLTPRDANFSFSVGAICAVGSYPANALGLFDMQGNACEWCADWYGAYPQDDVTNPAGPSEGSFRVLRGGGWNTQVARCRSANRMREAPGYRMGNLGFRVARSVPSAGK